MEVIAMFDREKVRELQDEINQMARELARKYGIEVIPASASYSKTEARFGFKFLTTNANGETQLESDFKRHAVIYGLSPKWLHQVIQDGDKCLEIIGLDLNKTKNVVMLLEQGSGKRFKAPAEFVKYRMLAQIDKGQNDPTLHPPSDGLEE
jgi:hypothetical protein